MSKANTQKNGWRKVKLGNFLDVKHGFAFKGEYITDEKNKNILVTPGNFHIGGGFKITKFKYYSGEIPSDYILKDNAIVITMTDLSKDGDTLGYSAKIPKSVNGEKYLHNQRIGLLQFHSEEINTDFIYWLLRTPDYHWSIVGAASGTSIRHTSPTTIKDLRFLLPSPREQKAIAEVLSSLDDKINLLHRQNKTLEEMAQTLFHKWFVDGGKDEWEEKSLDQIADYLNGIACQKIPPKNDIKKLPVLKIKELGNGINENSDWATSDVDKKYIVKFGDVIFSWSGSLMLKIWNGQDCVLNQHLYKVTSTEYPKWFYYFWTKHHLGRFIGIANSKATTMGHIKRSDLSFSFVAIPSTKELEQMNNLMEPIFNKIILNFDQSLQLSTLRKMLLPKLMEGELRVNL